MYIYQLGLFTFSCACSMTIKASQCRALFAISHLHLVEGETEEVERWDRVGHSMTSVMEISILCLIGHFSVASQSAPQAVFGRLLCGGSLDWLKQPSLIFCVAILTNNFTAFFLAR